MAITISSNIAALRAQKQLNDATDRLSTISARLSSGQRIVRASDDAAGLAVATSLNVDARVFAQGIRNINDGLSLLNIAEGALGELRDITIRQKELAEQAANGTYSFSQRKVMNTEANALVDEFNRIVASTKFNGRQVLAANNNELRIQVGYGESGSIGFAVGEALDRTVGDGTFGASNFQPTNAQATQVTTADINGDGKIDIVSEANTLGTIDVMLGNGDGTFLANVSYNGMSSVQGLELSDVNRDGILDVVASMDGPGKIGVMLGNSNGTFRAFISYAVGGNGTSLAMSDLNGDGFVDVAVASTASARVLFGNGDGTFRSATAYSLGSNGEDISIGDVNRDNILDLVVSTNGSASVLLGRGDGTFGTAVSYGVGTANRGITLSDLDGDGYLDIITADRDSDTLSILRGNANGSFLARTTLQTNSSPRDVVARDINGDGIPDLISADLTGNSATVFIGNGDGTFLSKQSYNPGSGPRGIAIADFNSDSALDMVVANFTGGTVNVLLGNRQDVVSIARMSLYSQAEARDALTLLDAQLTRITQELAAIGSGQSRLQISAKQLAGTRENYLQAASRITDADIAEEVARYTQTTILQQIGAAILAQANQTPELVLKLLN